MTIGSRFSKWIVIIAAVVVGTLVSTLVLCVVAGLSIVRDGLRSVKPSRWFFQRAEGLSAESAA